MLSVAEPSAFGFLDNNFSRISFEGRGKISEEQWDGNPSGLSVPEGKSISVISSNIEMKNSTWFETVEEGELGYVNPHAEKLTGSLTAPGGQINMAGIALAGEISVENGKPEIGDAPGGKITISGKSLLDVSGNGAGSVFIQSSKFVADDSAVYGKNFGDKDSGRIEIQADNISFENGSEISGDNYASGNGVDLTLKASETLTFSGADELKNASSIALNTHSKAEDAGDGGSIDISAKDILFSDGAYIFNSTFGSGNSGNVWLRAENDIRFKEFGYDHEANYYEWFYLGDNPVNLEASFGAIGSFAHYFSTGGNSGDIDIKGNNIFLTDGASIAATAHGTGNAGSISLRADHSILMNGSIGPESWCGWISVMTMGKDTGDIGRV